MKSFSFRVGTLVLALILCGCASTAYKAPSSNTAQPLLLPVKIVAQIDQDFQGYTESLDKRVGAAIYSRYQALLKNSPDYVPALRGLYSFYYFNAQLPTGAYLTQAESMAGLNLVYARLPALIRNEYYPPSFALYQRNAAIQASNPAVVSNELLLKNLRMAIQEAPENATARAILAEQLVTMGHAIVAKAVLYEAASYAPDEELYPYTLANYFYQTALDQACVQDNSEALRPALSLYRKTLNINSDADVHYQMGVIYGVLGLMPLMLNEAAVLAKKDDVSSLWQAAYLYVYGGNLSTAKRIFEQAATMADLKSQPQGRAYIDYLMLTRQWQAAVKHYPEYLQAKYALGSYDLLLASLMAAVAHAENRNVSFDDAWPKSSQLSYHHPWPVALFDVMAGDKDYQALAEQVEGNRCHQAQLHFYAGFNAWLNSDFAQAKQHVQKLSALKLPFSLESLLAETLLQ